MCLSPVEAGAGQPIEIEARVLVDYPCCCEPSSHGRDGVGIQAAHNHAAAVATELAVGQLAVGQLLWLEGLVPLEAAAAAAGMPHSRGGQELETGLIFRLCVRHTTHRMSPLPLPLLRALYGFRCMQCMSAHAMHTLRTYRVVCHAAGRGAA